MKKRTCGKSEFDLSILGLGCWQFGGGEYWGDSDQKNVTNLVHCAVDLGINYFDTAEMYNDGRSEEFLGKAFQGIPRDKIIVGSKVWPSNMHTSVLHGHLHASLKRLNMDYVDIYMLHWPLTERTYPMFIDKSKLKFVYEGQQNVTSSPVLEDTVAALMQLQKDGKIRHLGVWGCFQ